MAVIAANIQKLGQPVFDKDKIKAWSDRAAEFYSQFEGVEYCGTHILSRNKVWYDPDDQIRQLKVIMENVPALAKSFVNEIDYTQPPCSVEKVKEDNQGSIYKGRSGWTRDEAFNRNNWKHFYYDELKFKNDYCRQRYMAATNRNYLPRTGNTSGDNFRNIRKMIDNGLIPSTEAAISKEVKYLYVEGDDDDREKMIDELMSAAGIPIGDCRTYHSSTGRNSTQQWAVDNNRPYGGLQNKSLKDRVGYIMHSASAMGTWLNMIVKAYDLSCTLRKKVRCEALAYIKNPRPADFDGQREEFDSTYRITKSKLEKVILNCVSIVNGKLKVDIPVDWMGFLPQKVNPDPLKYSNPTEECPVDINGNPFKRK